MRASGRHTMIPTIHPKSGISWIKKSANYLELSAIYLTENKKIENCTQTFSDFGDLHSFDATFCCQGF